MSEKYHPCEQNCTKNKRLQIVDDASQDDGLRKAVQTWAETSKEERHGKESTVDSLGDTTFLIFFSVFFSVSISQEKIQRGRGWWGKDRETQ